MAFIEHKNESWFNATKVFQDMLASSDYQGPAGSVCSSVHGTEMVSLGNSENRTADPINSLYNRPKHTTPSNRETTISEENSKRLNPGADGCPSTRLKEANKSDLPPFSTYNLNSSPVNLPGDETHFGFANDGCPSTSNGTAGTSSFAQNRVDLLPENFSRVRRPRSKRYTPLELQNQPKGHSKRKDGRLPLITETRALVGDKHNNIDNHTLEPLTDEGDRLLISQIGGRKILRDNSDDIVTCTKENRVQKRCIIEVGPMTSNLDNEVIEGTKSKELSRNPKKVSAEVSGVQNLRVLQDSAVDRFADRFAEGDQLEHQVNTIQIRKRGRPRKNRGIAAAGMASKGVLENYVSPVVLGKPATKANTSLLNNKNVKLGKQILIGSVERNSESSSKVEVYSWNKDKVQCGRSVPVSAEKNEMDSARRGRIPTISLRSESSDQDCIVLSVSKIAEANGKEKESETAVVRLPGNFTDDRSLSMCLEAPNTTDGTKRRNEEQSTHTSKNDNAVLSLQCNDQSLPFAKSSPIWKTIESMEEFRQFPQNPHFKTLDKEIEGTREGSAIALMVHFATVIKQTSTLQFDDPKTRSTIDENLKILDNLEQNGFDVKVVRDRLEKLGDMKEFQKELVDKEKKYDDHITEKKNKNLKIDDRIEEIKNHIKLLQEEEARMETSKEKNDLDISLMQLSVDDISDGVRNIRIQFNTLVAKPWASA